MQPVEQALVIVDSDTCSMSLFRNALGDKTEEASCSPARKKPRLQEKGEVMEAREVMLMVRESEGYGSMLQRLQLPTLKHEDALNSLPRGHGFLLTFANVDPSSWPPL